MRNSPGMLWIWAYYKYLTCLNAGVAARSGLFNDCRIYTTKGYQIRLQHFAEISVLLFIYDITLQGYPLTENVKTTYTTI